uniref:Uncharacterized protein n=1 Tax=Rhinopithecus bieti TaxID=61621 RepID=A0A2K6LS98_RHIBE
MGFGSDLKNSHEAVLKLQDWELRLLETVKKFMNLCNQVDKESTVQMNYVSNVSKLILLNDHTQVSILKQ